MNFTAQVSDLLANDVQKPLPHHRADLVLEYSLEILNPGLHRSLNTRIYFHSVGWFQTFVQKTDGVRTPSDQPALLHFHTLTEKYPLPARTLDNCEERTLGY